MSAKKIEIEIGGENAIRTLDALEARANQLLQTLQSIAGTLGSGNASTNSQAEFFGGLKELSQVNGAIGAARASIAAGTSVNRDTLVAGAAAGSAAFGSGIRNRQVSDPQAILNMAQGVPGMSGNALAAVVGQLANGSIPYQSGSAAHSAVLQQVIQSVQAQQQMPQANPFAGASPMGPATPLGAPGYQKNVAYFQQQQQMQQQMLQTRQVGGLVAAGATGQYVSGSLDYATNQILNGGGSLVERGHTTGSAIGALIGGIAGIPFGAPGVATGAGIGSSVFGSAGAFLMAPLQNAAHMWDAQVPLSAASGWLKGSGNGDYTGGSFMRRSARFFGMERQINKVWDEPDQITGPQISDAWANLSEGLVHGGINPFDKAKNGFKYGATVDDIASANALARGPGNKLINTLNASAQLMAKNFGAGDEAVGEMYTRRLGRLFGGSQEGKALANASKDMAQIFASLPETGGNLADNLMKFGPTKTALFERIQTESLRAQVPIQQLWETSAAVRGAGRDASLGSLQARGSGAATEAAYRREMGAYASLPGGDQSLVYAEASARARDAGRAKFAQEDIGLYSIPAAHLAGERERLNVLPFNPGSRFSNDLRSISLANRELKRVGGYMAARKKSGELSEDEELSLTERMEGLETQKAYGIASLSSGFENRLPALSAGRGRTFNQFTSLQGAQLALYKVRSPIRDFGSINGDQKRDQDAFLDGFQVRQTGPRSRTQGLNNAGSSDRVESLLERIANALERNRVGGGARSGEIAGGAAGALAQRNPGRGLDGKAN
jgi:hypothetical protein